MSESVILGLASLLIFTALAVIGIGKLRRSKEGLTHRRALLLCLELFIVVVFCYVVLQTLIESR